MRCPACGHDNLEGDDACANCGASLLPAERTAGPGQDRLFGVTLAALAIDRPATIEAGTAVDAALVRMHEQAIDCLLVLGEGDAVVGIFTDRDALLKVAGRVTEAFDVRDVMTVDPVTLRPEDTLAVAIHKMAVGEFRHIPIVGDAGPVGVLAAKDVFRHVLEHAG